MSTACFYSEVENTTDNILRILSQDDMTDIATLEEKDLLKPNVWITVLAVVLLCLASFVGTGGNILTLLAYATCKNIRNKESLFLVNLALADLYVTVVADPMSVVGEYSIYNKTTHAQQASN